MPDDPDKTTPPRSGYDAQDITVLEGLEAVRKRPGMYIGSTGVRGLHHLVYEVVDNSVDEALAGYCDRVDVTIHPDNSITVVDNGRGIPVATMEKEGRPAVEVVLTVLHAGGKFGDGGGYKVSGGLHGVGVSVVNALSERLRVEVRRDGYVWSQEYARGVPQGDAAARASRRRRRAPRSPSCRTRRSSRRSSSSSPRSSSACARRRSSPAGCTSPSPTSGPRATRPSSTTRAASRTSSRYLNENKDPIQRRVIFFESDSEEGAVEVAMQWNSSYQESIFSFANNINTHEGGSHLSGFRSALTRTLNRYARDKGLLKEKDDNLSGEDVREGLTAVISAKLSDPQFEGQTKTKLGNPGMQGFVESVVNAKLGEFLEENPSEAQLRHPQGGLRRAGARRRAQGARPHAPQVRAGELRAAGQAGRLLDPRPRRSPSSSSWRATPPAARPSRAATARRRPCSPCAGRSSTSRRRGSTRSCRTRRSRRSSRRWARACARSSTRSACATTRSS